MRPVTDDYLRAILRPVARIAEVTVTLPGESTGTVVDVEAEDCNIVMDGSSNARYSASLSLSPDAGEDLFDLASTPGAAFAIRAGIDYGTGHSEWVDCGVLYAIEGDRDVALGDFPLTHQDGSERLAGCEFLAPWTVDDGTDRSDAIAAMVTDASPDVTIRQLASASLMGDAVYEKDRVAAILDVANGGSIDAAFDAAGLYVIRDMPTLNPSRPTWTARTGELGSILPGAQRKIPLNKLFNMVVVLAPEPFQTWGAVTYQIADDTHPRHWSKIGKRPFFVSDSTITSLAQAQKRGQDTLKRLLAVVEEITIPTLGNVALEYGDTITVAHQATETDPGLGANYFVEGWSFNLGTGEQEITGRSTDLPELEEA